MKKLNVLILMEESQEICKAFRKLGHQAFSCDLQECSGGHKEWHIRGDYNRCINRVNDIGSMFTTSNGDFYLIQKWDLIIAHPPCTYLSNAGSRFLNEDIYGQDAANRKMLRRKAISFFYAVVAWCELFSDHYAIENPLGCMSHEFRKPNQIIQPWQFGDNVQKSTCLWTKNLPNLVREITERPTPDLVTYVNRHGQERQMERFFYDTRFLPVDERRKQRSKTFPGIARAIAEQWSRYILEE